LIPTAFAAIPNAQPSSLQIIKSVIVVRPNIIAVLNLINPPILRVSDKLLNLPLTSASRLLKGSPRRTFVTQIALRPAKMTEMESLHRYIATAADIPGISRAALRAFWALSDYFLVLLSFHHRPPQTQHRLGYNGNAHSHIPKLTTISKNVPSP
jgi:hypothetical protein